MGKVSNRIHNLYNRKYDYYYLKSMLESKDSVTTIMAGSSYASFGIDPKPGQVNLGLPSQDIFFADKLIRKIVDESGSVKNVILVSSFYGLYCDLSKTKALSEQQRIVDVYLPLLNESHHMTEVSVPVGLKARILFFLDNCVCLAMRRTVFRKPLTRYFDDKYHSRLQRRLVCQEAPNLSWENLPPELRKKEASQRVASHEKSLRYSVSFAENVQMLTDLHTYLTERNIKLNIVIPPFTEEYCQCMSQDYLNAAKEAETFLRSVSAAYLDANKLPETEFTAQDFVDMDHLSDSGAAKLTQIINEWMASKS